MESEEYMNRKSRKQRVENVVSILIIIIDNNNNNNNNNNTATRYSKRVTMEKNLLV